MSNIALGDHFDRFVERQIASGRYRDAADVMRVALALLEELDGDVGAGATETEAFIARKQKAFNDARRPSRYGYMRGTVRIPEGFDLTAPALDEVVHAETGRIHE